MAQMDTNKKDLLAREEGYAIVGAAMEVHNQLRAGFAEAVYQQATEIEFGLRGIPFERQKRLKISYKGHPLDLKATGMRVGILINSEDPACLEYKRMVL